MEDQNEGVTDNCCTQPVDPYTVPAGWQNQQNRQLALDYAIKAAFTSPPKQIVEAAETFYAFLNKKD